MKRTFQIGIWRAESLEILTMPLIVITVICIAAFSRNFPDLEMSSAGRGGRQRRVTEQGTCQPVELGRNSVN